jgi:hypothetical protein
MAKKRFTASQVKRITGAARHESIQVPFYYAPPFLDELREVLKARLSSQGGRPTMVGAEVVRKVRFSEENWEELEAIAESWRRRGVTVSPAQVATTILDQVISAYRREREQTRQR